MLAIIDYVSKSSSPLPEQNKLDQTRSELKHRQDKQKFYTIIMQKKFPLTKKTKWKKHVQRKPCHLGKGQSSYLMSIQLSRNYINIPKDSSENANLDFALIVFFK